MKMLAPNAYAHLDQDAALLLRSVLLDRIEALRDDLEAGADQQYTRGAIFELRQHLEALTKRPWADQHKPVDRTGGPLSDYA